MSPAASFALACAVGYAAGSLPSAYIAGRVLRGVDLRRVGSGNLGATNVYRELGARAAGLVLAVDVAKGWLPVALLPGALGAGDQPWWPIAIGAATIAGHARSVFLFWRGGGKGVATGAGVFAALAPAALCVALGVFLIVVAMTRIVAAGSIAAAAALPVAIAFTHGPRSPQFAAGVLIGAFIIGLHRDNIGRIVRREEPRFGRTP